MIERLRRHAAGLPRVLVGDFNLTPDTPGHGRLIEGAGLRDLWEALGKGESEAGTCHDWDGKPKTRIDWILASPDLEPESIERSMYRRDGRYPSDHFPVVACFA
jgi:endonuclease/exonuclease/phosphatase family metal-dependent hydrolase